MNLPTQEEINGVAAVFKRMETDSTAQGSALIVASWLKDVFRDVKDAEIERLERDYLEARDAHDRKVAQIEQLRGMLTEFGKHKNWELVHSHKVYADDDEPEVDHWAVLEVTGPINDREWEEIGGGDTPEAAISAALSRSVSRTAEGGKDAL